MSLFKKSNPALLVLQDGTVFEGNSFGAEGEATGEVVFNTSMTGYQEILTDPSYKGQMVTLTYPMIGNYGVNRVDQEKSRPQVEALIVKEYSKIHSNYRASNSLADYLNKHGIVGIEGLDTRSLVKHIREKGAMPGIISTKNLDVSLLKKQAQELPSMEGQDLVSEVTCAKPYSWKKPTQTLNGGNKNTPLFKKKKKVVALDLGLKENILRNLVDIGCEVEILPATASVAEILKLKPDGVFLSNGPGDPAAVHDTIETVKELAGKVPLFGICLGHQILGLSQGAKTFKLKFGHRGANHPIKNLETGKVEITSQNHGFAIDKKSFPKIGELTHVNLNDQTVAGFENKKKRLFGVQYHPESSPGPHDSLYLFEKFGEMMGGKSSK